MPDGAMHGNGPIHSDRSQLQFVVCLTAAGAIGGELSAFFKFFVGVLVACILGINSKSEAFF